MYNPKWRGPFIPKLTDGMVVCKVCTVRKARTEFDASPDGLRLYTTCKTCTDQIKGGLK